MLACFNIESVSADCNKHTTSRLLKNQISLKSVTMVVDSGCDYNNCKCIFHCALNKLSSEEIRLKAVLFMCVESEQLIINILL